MQKLGRPSPHVQRATLQESRWSMMIGAKSGMKKLSDQQGLSFSTPAEKDAVFHCSQRSVCIFFEDLQHNNGNTDEPELLRSLTPMQPLVVVHSDSGEAHGKADVASRSLKEERSKLKDLHKSLFLVIVALPYAW